MSKSISKMRHIQMLNENLERRLISEKNNKYRVFEQEFDDEDSVKDLPSVDITVDKFKMNCEEVVDLMDDVLNKLEDCCESEDSKNEFINNCRKDVEKLIDMLAKLNDIKVTDLDKGQENPFGV
jgi:hypothetical protein